MADTTFTNGVTLTDAAWFNDLNRLHYTILANPATLAALQVTVGIPRSHLAGCTLSTAGASATMSIAAGQAADSTNASLMTVAAIAKTTSAWAVGTGNGGLDTGAIANSTWYHFYAIKRVDTSVVDVLFSLSASAPTMPTNYTLKRRIGSGLTNGSAQWTAFTQDGDYFLWLASVNDINSVSNPGTAAVTRALTVPTGVNVLARVNLNLVYATAATSGLFYASDLAANDEAAASGRSQIFAANAGGGQGSTEVIVRTNTLSQIRTRLSFSDASTSINGYTLGWFDRRGRDA